MDRLNGLLEPNGSLKIHELGTARGEIPEVFPHPSFRLFLNMDPKYGEISRAMRNRGVEICVGVKKDEGSNAGVETLEGGLSSGVVKVPREPLSWGSRSYDDEEVTAMMASLHLPVVLFEPLLSFWSSLSLCNEGLRDVGRFMKACQVVQSLHGKSGGLMESLNVALTLVFAKGCHDIKIKSVRGLLFSCF